MGTVTTLFAAAGLVAGLCGEHAFAQTSKPKALLRRALASYELESADSVVLLSTGLNPVGPLV